VIQHILLFTFKASATSHDIRRVLTELEAFPARFPEILTWRVGTSVSTRDSTFTHGAVGTFADERALAAYLASDEHESFVAGLWSAHIERRAIVSLPY
jgi:hypothetical protein